jgi:hypothetical protein
MGLEEDEDDDEQDEAEEGAEEVEDGVAHGELVDRIPSGGIER